LISKNLRQPYRGFAAGWLLVLSYDLTMVVIGLINPVTNHRVYNIAFIFQHLLIIWFFARLIKQRNFHWLLVIYGAFGIADLLFIQGATTLNTYSLAIAGVIILALAVLRIYEIYQEDTSENLFREADFWYCTGFILYWGLAAPYFAMFNYLWENFTRFSTIYFYTFSYGCTLLLNLSIIKALLCHRTIQRSSSSWSLPT
jgi:hypothetical protein